MITLPVAAEEVAKPTETSQATLAKPIKIKVGKKNQAKGKEQEQRSNGQMQDQDTGQVAKRPYFAPGQTAGEELCKAIEDTPIEDVAIVLQASTY